MSDVTPPSAEPEKCPDCGHSLVNNSHGFDQNDGWMDGDKLIHSGRCTYCKECNPRLRAAHSTPPAPAPTLGKQCEAAVQKLMGWCDCGGEGCDLCRIAKLVTKLWMDRVSMSKREITNAEELAAACAADGISLPVAAAPAVAPTLTTYACDCGRLLLVEGKVIGKELGTGAVAPTPQPDTVADRLLLAEQKLEESNIRWDGRQYSFDPEDKLLQCPQCSSRCEHGYCECSEDVCPECLRRQNAEQDAEDEANFQKNVAGPLLGFAQQPEEIGWLLARGGNGKPLEWITVESGFLMWNPDANKALRLARRADADKLAEIVEDCERIEDHIWLAGGAVAETPQPWLTKYAEATKLAMQNNQTVGGDGKYFVTLEQLENILRAK